MSKTYKSDVHAAIHRTMEDLSEVGLVDEITMENYDGSCLVQVEALPSKEIRQTEQK